LISNKKSKITRISSGIYSQKIVQSRVETMENDVEEKWYKDGLRFSCTQCGKCCTGRPGVTWISLDEMQKLAEYLKISMDDLIKKYLRKVDGKWALKERLDHSCVFLYDKKCRVYEVRPRQCQTFPFWKQALESKDTWDQLKNVCEGIREDAELISQKEIDKQLVDEMNFG
jgi:uncharacterized protein